MQTRSALTVAFGQIVREMRGEAGLSQERLASLARLSRNYVGQVERGENSPTLDAVAALASALGKSPGALIEAAEERAR